MYKLNKFSILKCLKLRGIFLSKKVLKRKHKQTLIYLRSPKHFNIGKQKVLSFNNKYTYNLLCNYKIASSVYIYSSHYFFKILNFFFKFNSLFRINSIKVKNITKIKFI